MLDFCTCGAKLPPDALFCHKCGKPQRALSAAIPEPAAAVELPAVTPVAPAVELPQPGFRNPAAVRVAVLAAFLTLPVCWIPMVSLVAWVAAGFFAVHLYRRRTGQRLDWRGGMRIGWMTGFITFAILTVLFTVAVAMLSAAGGPAALSQPQFRNLPMYDEKNIEALKAMLSVPGVLQALASTFITTMMMCGAGGAIGAQLAARD